MTISIAQIKREALERWRPPPRLLVSEWAEQYRFLSPEAAAEHGKWHNIRAPHLVMPMDALSPHDTCQEVVLKFSAQTGKTEVVLNFIGYIIDQDPGPTLCIQPNVSPMGEAFSKDRIAPMIRDTPVLKDRVADARERDSGNTLSHKKFGGGHLTIAGANSPAGLASRPIRYLLGDELNRWETTKEGSPLALARKRTQTFHNRKICLVSSPTLEGMGIDAEYQSADQQWELHLTCPDCKATQMPKLRHFVWPKDGSLKDASYVCEHCGVSHPIDREPRIKATASWVCMKDDGERKKAFWANQFASPFASWIETLEEFLKSKDDPESLKTFVNTALAENWEGDGKGAEQEELSRRREIYLAEVPAGVLVLTAGVDIQQDRIEIEVVGWNELKESWTVDFRVLIGDPEQPEVWNQLDEVLLASWKHEEGHDMRIAAACVDSGYSAANVYAFCAPRFTRGVYAVKGLTGSGRPVARTGTPGNIKGPKPLSIYLLGVDEIKGTIYSYFASERGQAGFCHWPTQLPGGRELHDQYFEQLTAEKQVKRFHKGFPRTEWIKVRKRNEALDCRVYAYAALTILNPMWTSIQTKMIQGPRQAPVVIRRPSSYLQR